MIVKRAYTLLMAEAAALLAAHGQLLCCPAVEQDDKELVITLRMSLNRTDSVPKTLNLLHAMEYLVDQATLRALAHRYDIPFSAFEALMPKQED